MSADYFLLYYGIRLPTGSEEGATFEAYERETHPHQVAAKTAGLDTWWANFDEDGQDRYLLFIGAELGIFGHEDAMELSLSDDRLIQTMQEVKAKLRAAGFEQSPAVLAQFARDQ